jgi:pantetheine-phosphate adenylyltransferase
LTCVLYPGSFDPFHNGHRELVETASYLFDDVVVGAIRNPQKGDGLFSLAERKEMIDESLAHLDNVRVVSLSKLVVEVAKEVGADVIVKGLRAVSDAESEITQAQMNLAISGIHTIFIPSASASSFLASKLIREVARFGGDVSDMVPLPVAKRLKDRFGAEGTSVKR